MTTPADARTDEEAFAACLAGRPVPAGAQGLAAFTDAVRSSATAPGRPNAALTELLATGLLVPTQEPSRGTAGRPARTSRKRPHVLISTLVAKFAAAGAVAKAAAASGVVAVALTGAATAGTLTAEEPPPVVQDDAGVNDTPEDATVGETPSGDNTSGDTDTGDMLTGDTAGDGSADLVADEGGAGDEVSGDPTTVAPVTGSDPESPEDAEDGKPTDQEKFDRHPENPGRAASAEAHKRNADRKAERAVQPEAGAPEDEGTDEVLEAEQTPVVEQPAAPAPHPGNGNGNGNGKK